MQKQIEKTLLIVFIGLILMISHAHAAKVEEFIPNDSILYFTLRDLDEVWTAVEKSENWKAVGATPALKGQIDGINQAINMLQLMVGTDLQSMVEMLGHQIAYTVFPGSETPMIGLIVHTSGAIREVERIVNGLAQMAGSSEGNRVVPNAGKYQKIEYSTAQLGNLSLTYAFVDDLFVVGLNPGSFEGLIDTYRKQRMSITSNEPFRKLYQKFTEGQVFGFVDLDRAIPLLTAKMDAAKRREFNVLGLDSLQTLGYSLDVLNVGGSHQLYAQIKPDRRSGLLGALLQEGQPLQSIQALSGDEDLFISIAPSGADAIWRVIETIATAADDSGGFYNGIAQIEALLNLNIKNDVLGALTGEIAVWGQFTKGMSGKPKSPMDLLYEIDAAIVAGLKNPSKWKTFLDSIQNLVNIPIQQYQYKGTTLHRVSLPPETPTLTVSYGYVKNLFLVSFSDKRFESVVDNASAGRAVSPFQKRFKQLPANPTLLLQLKLDKLLPVIMGSEGKTLSADAMKRLGGVGPLIGSLTVNKGEAELKIEFISDEEAIETYGRLASVIVPAIAK